MISTTPREETEKLLEKFKSANKSKPALKELQTKIEKMTDRNLDFEYLLQYPQRSDPSIILLYVYIIKVIPKEFRSKIKKLIQKLICFPKADFKQSIEAMRQLTNNWTDLNELNENLLLQFIIYKCFLKEDLQITSLFPLLQLCLNSNKLMKYQFEVVTEFCLLIALNYRSNSSLKDTEAQIFLVIDTYIKNNTIKKKVSTLKLIICYLLLGNNIERDNVELMYLIMHYPKEFMRCVFELRELEKANKNCTDNLFIWTKVNNVFYFEEYNEIFREEIKKNSDEYSNNYRKFFEKLNPNLIFVNEKKNIITFLLSFLYNVLEKCEIIEAIKDYIGLLLKFLMQLTEMSKEYNNGILKVIYRLIEQKGKMMFSEWNIIFTIIFKALDNGKSDLIYEEIIALLYSLYMRNEFNGEIGKVKEFLLLRNEKIKNENLVIFKYSLILGSYEDFVNCLEDAIKEIDKWYKEGYTNLVLLILNAFESNYAKAMSDIRKDKRADVIEQCMIKYYEFFVNLIKDTPKLCTYFCYALSEILSITNNTEFFTNINKKILNYKDEWYNQLKNLYSLLFSKLSNNNKSNHILILKKILFNIKNFKTNNVIMKCALILLKNCIINRNYEIQFTPIKTNEVEVLKYTSLIIMDYKNKEITKRKEELGEKYKEYKSKCYAPYIPLNIKKIFYFILNFIKENFQLEKLENKELEDIIKVMYEFLNHFVRSIFLITTVDVSDLTSRINKNKTEDYTVSNKTKYILYIKQNILLNLAYHINPNLKNTILKFDNIIKESTPEQEIIILKTQSLITLYNIWKCNFCLPESSNYKENFKMVYFTSKILKLFLVSSIETFNPHPPKEKYIKRSISQNKKYIINTNINDNTFLQTLPLPKNLLNVILGNLFYFIYKYNYCLMVVSFLYETKEVFFSSGEEIFFKVILVLLCIGWQYKINEIVTSFDKYFAYENSSLISEFDILKDIIKKKRLDKVRGEKNHNINKEKVFCEFVDMVTLCYFNHCIPGEILFTVIEECFKDRKNSREFTFYELAKWNLSSRTKRHILDYTDSDRKNKNMTQVYFGNNNIIMAIPIEKKRTKVIFRNAICNQTIIFTSFYNEEYLREWDEYIKNKNLNARDDSVLSLKNNIHKLLDMDIDIDKINKRKMTFTKNNHFLLFDDIKQEEQKRREKDDQYRINNANILIYQITSLTSEPIENFKYLSPNSHEEIIKTFYSSLLLLDEIPPFFVKYCGVLYIPNTNTLNEDYLYEFNAQVSDAYIRFLNRLGDVVDITKTAGVDIGKIMSKEGSDGLYVIQYTEALVQVVFHVASLITNVKKRKSIIQKDNVVIAWNENPLREFDRKVINKSNEILVFIIINPLCATHYSVKSIFNKKAEETVKKKIGKIFPKDFVINITTDNAIQQLVMMVIEIGYIIKMKIGDDNKGEENNFVKRRDYLSSIMYSYKPREETIAKKIMK